MTDDTPAQNLQEPTPEPEPRRLKRSGSDAIVGGVASGLGRYFGVDPILFRIGFVVLAFIGAAGGPPPPPPRGGRAPPRPGGGGGGGGEGGGGGRAGGGAGSLGAVVLP